MQNTSPLISMSLTSLLLAELLLVTTATASHFYGGSMTFNPRRNHDGSYKVELRFKTTYHSCYGYDYWQCSSGQCGNDVSTVIGKVDSSPNGGSWCQSEGVITKMVSTNSPFQLLKSGCCWIYNTVTDSGDWSLLTYIDLGVRSDTSEPNRSPISTTLPFVRVPQNCPRRYNLLAFDPDGDHVTCRFGLRQNQECGICNQPAGFTLNEHNCSLSYSHTSFRGVYSFELVLEDFPVRKITLSYTNQPSKETFPISFIRNRRSAYYYGTTIMTPTSTTESTATTAESTKSTTESTTTTTDSTTITPTTNYPTTKTTKSTTTDPTTTTELTTTTTESTTMAPTTNDPTTTTTKSTTTTTDPTTTTESTTSTTDPTTTTESHKLTCHPTTTTIESTTMTPTTTDPTTRTLTPPTTAESTTMTTSELPTTTIATTTQTTTTFPITTTATTTTTLALSKIPLQFSLQVDGPAPSCTEGEYLPRFLHPTPHHGEQLSARVNQELEIRVKASASFSTIIDVIISGPLNSTKYKTTTGEYVINWTPTAENYGQHFPFCFIAEGQFGSNIYHSEMRCVVAKVNGKGPEANVTCSQNSMSVTIKRSSIKNLHGDHLRLINPSCRVYTNSTHLFTNTLLNDCGTQIEENNNELIFKNKIITFDDPRDIITRKDNLEIEILCKYQKRTNVTLDFYTHRPPIFISEKGFGTFNYQFEFYASANFQNSRHPESYPLEYDVGDKIFMKIEPVTPVLNTEIFLESCVATPYDNPNYPVSYPIIKNGCTVDETVRFFSSHQPYVQFEMEAFKFIGFHDQVFISCSIIICEANNPYTRCSQGCINSTVAPPAHHHHRREAPIQTGSHVISQGPLRLKRSASQVTVSPGLNLNLVVVAVCLVATVAMVCGVIVYRARGQRIRYQPLSSHDF
uniref:ZP domain-containing protein n=1 Tax=Cyprinus carpio TaxID=7962 RepID=A0A8C1T6D4_CYPCA